MEREEAQKWLAQARVLRSEQRYDKALVALMRAQRMFLAGGDTDPQQLGAIERLRGNIYKDQGRFDDAVVAYERGVALMSDSVDILIDLGEVLYKSGRFEEALGVCDSALRLQPNAPRSIKNRVAALFQLNRYDEAVTECDRVIAMAPDDAYAWHWKGDILLRMKHYDEAMAAFEEALKVAPDDKTIQASRDSLLPWMRRTVADQRIRLPDGRWLGYLDFGDPDGVPVFYFHGLPGSRLEMALDESLFKELHIRIIAADRPGYGLSTYQHGRKVLDWPNDVEELANHLNIARFIVFGSSAGGAYAAACAYKIPECLLACGLAASVAPPHAYKDMFEWTPPHISRAVARYSPMPVQRLLAAMGALQTKLTPGNTVEVIEQRNQGVMWSPARRSGATAHASTLTPVVREIILEPWRQGGDGYARDNWLSAHAWGFPLEDIRMPVHLWHGELDVMSPVRAARYLASNIPHCQATYFLDARHDLFKEHGREILIALLAAVGADVSAQEP